jgi:hypothetical protein
MISNKGMNKILDVIGLPGPSPLEDDMCTPAQKLASCWCFGTFIPGF